MRKVELGSLKATLSHEAAQAREKLAATFSPEAVRAACTDAAQKGFDGCTIQPSAPVNVRQTATVAKLLAWLEKEGLRHEWVLRRDSPDGPEYPRLIVTWDVAAAPAAAPLSGVRNANE